MNNFSAFLKENRKKLGYTQEEFALRSGLSIKFIRSLEQGKETLRLDKVEEALQFFGYTCGPVKMTKQKEIEE